MNPESDSIMYLYAKWKVMSGASMVGLSAMPTIVLNWDTMTGAGRIVATIGLAIAVVKSVDMAFDQTVSRLLQGKPLVSVPGLDTEHFKKDSSGGVMKVTSFLLLGLSIALLIGCAQIIRPYGKEVITKPDGTIITREISADKAIGIVPKP